MGSFSRKPSLVFYKTVNIITAGLIYFIFHFKKEGLFRFRESPVFFVYRQTSPTMYNKTYMEGDDEFLPGYVQALNSFFLFAPQMYMYRFLIVKFFGNYFSEKFQKYIFYLLTRIFLEISSFFVRI